MALVMHACEKLLLHYSVFWLKCTDNSYKTESHYHGQGWTMWLLWRYVQTSHIAYLQFVEGRHLHTALLCSNGYGASAVARPLDRKG